MSPWCHRAGEDDAAVWSVISRMSEELGEREKEVLRAVVQEYITTGGPVGSHHLSRKPEFDVSSATLRNVLADLEELGFLEKPHTSAGRVPTDRGYRFYVDTLVRLKEPAPKDRRADPRGARPGDQPAGSAR